MILFTHTHPPTQNSLVEQAQNLCSTFVRMASLSLSSLLLSCHRFHCCRLLWHGLAVVPLDCSLGSFLVYTGVKRNKEVKRVTKRNRAIIITANRAPLVCSCFTLVQIDFAPNLVKLTGARGCTDKYRASRGLLDHHHQPVNSKIKVDASHSLLDTSL